MYVSSQVKVERKKLRAIQSPEGAWSDDSPQGDRKGPHPAPHRPRPYYEVIITHIFWSISVNRGDKAFRMVAFVHKLCPVIPLHKRPQKDMGNDDTMRTKGSLLAADHSRGGGGVEWGGDPCGRPGGCNVSGREGRPGG